MPAPAPSNRKWKIALVAAIVAGPLLGVFGNAWASHAFPDVPNSNIFHDQIGWAAESEVVNGYTNGKFGPNDPVNRGQAAAFLSNYNDAIHAVTTQETPSGPATAWLVNSHCPVGERAIGGSAHTDMNNVFIADTFLSGAGYGVRFETEANESREPLAMNVTVVCAPGAIPPALSGSSLSGQTSVSVAL